MKTKGGDIGCLTIGKSKLESWKGNSQQEVEKPSNGCTNRHPWSSLITSILYQKMSRTYVTDIEWHAFSGIRLDEVNQPAMGVGESLHTNGTGPSPGL